MSRLPADAGTTLGVTDDQYRSLFENSSDAILLANPEGVIEAANPAACRIFLFRMREIRRRIQAPL